MLTQPLTNLSAMTGAGFTTAPADSYLEENNVIEQAGMTLSVLHTPGHTPGGISLYAKDEGVVFAGDTLFAGSVGRTDFLDVIFLSTAKSQRPFLLAPCQAHDLRGYTMHASRQNRARARDTPTTFLAAQPLVSRESGVFG